MADAITPGSGAGAGTDCGGATPPAVAVPHLADGIVSEILYRLPTRDAYRLAAVCSQWRSVLYQPTFFSRHLSPRPLPLLDDRPYALVVQPRRRVGFTHLTLVAIDPADRDRVGVDLSVRPKYIDLPPPPPRTRESPHPPPPSLLDRASFFRLLYSTGVDDDDDDVPEDDDDVPENPEDDAPEPGAVSLDDSATPAMDVAAPDAVPADPAPASPLEVQVKVEDYVVFFERTVPMLDMSIVASHGRLLLGRSRSRYYVCDPVANRWLALPPSTTPPVRHTNSGLHYDILDASTGRLAFTVVLLIRLKRRRMLVETFSSATGMWVASELPAQGVARCLGAASPGVHVGTCFYWLSWRRGCILRYDASLGRASVLREPPQAEQSKARVGRSLGSVDGRLRLCTFDIRDDRSESIFPDDDDLEGVHGVWLMDGPAAAWSWRRVVEAVVEDIWYYGLNHEMPVDFAGACGEFIVVDKQKFLLRYDLESGNKVELASLYRNSVRLGRLYRRYHAFPFFR